MIDEKRCMVADIFLSIGGLEEDDKIHCLFSRAFVQDRELYRSGVKQLYVSTTVNGYEAEEGTPQEGSSNEELDEETMLMASMGLPVQFGRMSARKQCAALSEGLGKNTKNKWNGSHKNAKSTRQSDPVITLEAKTWSEVPGVTTDQGKPTQGDVVPVNTGEPRVALDWERYWSQYGEGLLWQSWLEKHLEYSECQLEPPWDDADCKAEWEQHANEIYCHYWEQFQYWATQGWTVDDSCSSLTEAGENPEIHSECLGGGVVEQWYKTAMGMEKRKVRMMTLLNRNKQRSSAGNHELDAEENPGVILKEAYEVLGLKWGAKQKFGNIPNFTDGNVHYHEKGAESESKLLDMHRPVRNKKKHVFFNEEGEILTPKKSKTLSKVQKFLKQAENEAAVDFFDCMDCKLSASSDSEEEGCSKGEAPLLVELRHQEGHSNVPLACLENSSSNGGHSQQQIPQISEEPQKDLGIPSSMEDSEGNESQQKLISLDIRNYLVPDAVEKINEVFLRLAARLLPGLSYRAAQGNQSVVFIGPAIPQGPPLSHSERGKATHTLSPISPCHCHDRQADIVRLLPSSCSTMNTPVESVQISPLLQFD
ncbi:TGS1 synthase, partial [Polyodon spathula]|nr:TGS1 synthase [Polyodon spathula]